jgi:hypothetical protein
MPGIDPGASRMQSERSTKWATSLDRIAEHMNQYTKNESCFRSIESSINSSCRKQKAMNRNDVISFIFCRFSFFHSMLIEWMRRQHWESTQ